ncbi:unnamed protein product [Amoebophrya sp. A25]|nr:unnamed protein product [Amoebophrya sp. A25]|eukprot:GSA25T00011482001.1
MKMAVTSTTSKTSNCTMLSAGSVLRELRRKAAFDSMRSEFSRLVAEFLAPHAYTTQEASTRRKKTASANAEDAAEQHVEVVRLQAPEATSKSGSAPSTTSSSSRNSHSRQEKEREGERVKNGNRRMKKNKSTSPTTSSPLHLEPPREALNRFIFSGDEESLAFELLDDLPLKLDNWYPTELEKALQNRRAWRACLLQWLQDHDSGSDEGPKNETKLKKPDHVSGHVWKLLEVEPSVRPGAAEDAVQDSAHEEIASTANALRTAAREIVAPKILPIARRIAVEMTKLRASAFQLDLCEDANGKGVTSADTSAENVVERGGQEGIKELERPEQQEPTVEVDYDPKNRLYTLSIKEPDESADNSVCLSEWAMQKLSTLFDKNCGIEFYTAVFCCALRYTALCGEDIEGAGLQAAMPQRVFDVLPSSTMECFASPFNVSRQGPISDVAELQSSGTSMISSVALADSPTASTEAGEGGTDDKATAPDKQSDGVEAASPARKKRKTEREAPAELEKTSRSSSSSSTFHPYCSVFPEDRAFGSSGSFFDLDALPSDTDLFEVNPPFDVVFIERTLEKIENHLGAGCGRPLAFLIILPEWLSQGAFRAKSPIDDVLLKSFYLRATAVRRPHKHKYVRGRCWHWRKLPTETGPPLQPGISKSRATILSNYLTRKAAQSLLDKVLQRMTSQVPPRLRLESQQ